MAGAPASNTVANVLSGYKEKKLVPAAAISTATKRAWHTASCTPSLFPLAFSLLTKVEVTLGKKDASQNPELNTCVAAAYPATARALPMRLVQKGHWLLRGE